MDSFGQNYLRLTLEINKHIDGYIDAYFGPADLKAEVEATPKKSPAALLDDLAGLEIPADDPQRHDYLSAVLRAMDCTLRMLNGEQFDYLDEVERLFDVQPAKVDESVFETAHRELDTLLPGAGSLAERLQTWRSQFEIPQDRLPEILEIARVETRQRTAALIDLVAGESLEVTMTNNQPWSAYNWFKGNAHSLIEFNTDIPVSALRVADLFAHEGYPGHHTEHQLKEKLLYQGKGHAECAAQLLHSPSAVISEGIAMTAVEMIFPNDSFYDWTAEVILPAANLPAVSGDTLKRITKAQVNGRAVSNNAAILYHTGQMNEAQMMDYYRQYALETEKRARQMFNFISSPLFRAYTFTYTQGYELIERATQDQDKLPLFKRLLTEEIRPATLAKM